MDKDQIEASFYFQVCKRLAGAEYHFASGAEDYSAEETKRSRHLARRLQRHVLGRLSKPLGDQFDLELLGDHAKEREFFIDWLLRGSVHAGSYCSPSWTRTYSAGVVAVLKLQRENDPVLDLWKARDDLRDLERAEAAT